MGLRHVPRYTDIIASMTGLLSSKRHHYEAQYFFEKLLKHVIQYDRIYAVCVATKNGAAHRLVPLKVR